MRLVHDRASGTAVRADARRAQPGRPRTGLRDSPRLRGQLVVLVVALAAIVAGSFVLADRLLSPRPDQSAEATLHGLSATVTTAGWVAMDVHTMDQGGFQMPAQMMPGAPEGDQMRLGVPITLHNTDGVEQWFNLPEEFTVVGGANGRPVSLHSDTFGLLNRLAPDVRRGGDTGRDQGGRAARAAGEPVRLREDHTT